MDSDSDLFPLNDAGRPRWIGISPMENNRDSDGNIICKRQHVWTSTRIGASRSSKLAIAP